MSLPQSGEPPSLGVKKKKPTPELLRIPTLLFLSYHISFIYMYIFLFCLCIYYLSPPTDYKLHNGETQAYFLP